MHRPHRWARSCPTTRSRTSTRAHYGLSRGYRNRRAVTAGRARATTASCKATQLFMYGSSLGLGLWPLDQKPRLPVPTTCVAAPHSRLHDRRIEPCGSDRGSEQPVPGPAPLASKYTTPPRRVKRAAQFSACPHRCRLHCCDIASTAGARHIMVADRRPEGCRCGGFGGHLTAPRTSATPVSACTEVSGWLGGGRASRARTWMTRRRAWAERGRRSAVTVGLYYIRFYHA